MKMSILVFVVGCFVTITNSNVLSMEGPSTQSVIRILEDAKIEYRRVLIDTNGLLVVDLCESNIKNLSILKGFPISVLSLRQTEVSDLTPLSGMPLTVLDVSSTLVTNLTPLTNSPLHMLNCALTSINTLECIRGMSLSVLVATDTPITTIEPLCKMPLHSLDISGTFVTNLTCIGRIPLEALRFSPERIKSGMDTIRNMKSLTDIGVMYEVLSAADFWTRYDKGDFHSKRDMPLLTPGMIDTLKVLEKNGVK